MATNQEARRRCVGRPHVVREEATQCCLWRQLVIDPRMKTGEVVADAEDADYQSLSVAVRNKIIEKSSMCF